MRKLITFILIIVLSVGGYASPKKSFEIKRGVNLSHWLSQRGENTPSIQDGMSATDFSRIARAGFDHVRLPIDEEVLWQEIVVSPEPHNHLGFRRFQAFHMYRFHHYYCFFQLIAIQTLSLSDK